MILDFPGLPCQSKGQALKWQKGGADRARLQPPMFSAAGFSQDQALGSGESKGGGEMRLEPPHSPQRSPGRMEKERTKALFVGEGLFGALKTRLACGFLQEALPSRVQRRALLEAVAQSLRVFLTLFWPLRWFLEFS